MSLQISLADRLSSVKESSTLKMNAAAKELAAKGVKVINFAAGEPDFPVPSVIQDAAHEAIQSGFNKYTAVTGTIELRNRIAQKLKEENALQYKSDQIIVSTGAKQAIFNLLLALVGEGDEVIIPSPFWVSYPEMVRIAGGNPVIVKTGLENHFKLTPQALKQALTAKTKVLLLNSPSNPAGIVYSENEMRELAKVLEGTNVIVASDEIYEKLVYEGKFASFGAVSADAFERTVTINGFSKSHCVTGWRIGYAAGPKKIIDAMAVLQGQSTSGASSIVQKAMLAAFDVSPQEMNAMVESFRRRRDIMMGIFSRSKRLSFIAPSGAFYVFLNVEKVLGKQYNHDEILTSTDEIAMYLLNIAHVGTVSGAGFGHDEYIRLSYAVSDADVKEGSQKVLEALENLR